MSRKETTRSQRLRTLARFPAEVDFRDPPKTPIYLSDGFAAEQVISEWMTFYSDVRPHSALGGCTRTRAAGRGTRTTVAAAGER